MLSGMAVRHTEQRRETRKQPVVRDRLSAARRIGMQMALFQGANGLQR
jgi:hypothetical protein